MCVSTTEDGCSSVIPPTASRGADTHILWIIKIEHTINRIAFETYCTFQNLSPINYFVLFLNYGMCRA